jgi:predicted NAD/FAD-binding protein
MNIAVVGAGVSGLVVAHMLADQHRVTVFEAAEYAGGHTNTVPVQTSAGQWAVDTGFIVLNDRNYPNFERLLQRLGVATQVSDMSFSVADEAGRFEYAATSLNGLYATRSNIISPRFQRMVAEVPRFQRTLCALIEGDDGISLAGFLAREGFSRSFVDRLIVPQVAAVWSADPRAMDHFPARFLAEFFHNHGMLSLRHRPEWRTVRGGSRTYVDAICKRLTRLGSQVRLNAPVVEISRGRDGVGVQARGGEAESFDHVVVATHSDQALAMLAEPTDTEHELLSAIPYQSNEAVLHTDVRLLPQRRRAWASWNYHLLDTPSDRATVTYHMNRLQNLDAPQEFCVTLNHTAAIDPAAVIASFEYAHPVFTPEGVAAQARVGEISGADRVHYCGAYWGWGFHEDGVASGVRVAETFGVRL